MFTVGPAGLPQIRAGRIRGLAVSTAKRSAFAPELPTVAEAGLAGLGGVGREGGRAPAGKPQAPLPPHPAGNNPGPRPPPSWGPRPGFWVQAAGHNAP